MHWLEALALLLLIMAELACPSCGKIVKGEHEHVETIGEEERRVCLEAEQQAEQEHLEWQQDAFLAYDGPDFGKDVEWWPSGLPTHNCHLPQQYHDDPPALAIPIPIPIVTEESEPGESNVFVLMDDVAPQSSSTHSLYVYTQSDGNDLFC
ncbi:hypothetical protein V8B97DRAFT_1914697 [Scleroderma yunnanense]